MGSFAARDVITIDDLELFTSDDPYDVDRAIRELAVKIKELRAALTVEANARHAHNQLLDNAAMKS